MLSRILKYLLVLWCVHLIGGGGLAAQSWLTLAIWWTVSHQAPPSMGFSRQEYWSGLPFPPPGDLPNPGTEPRSPALQADSLPSEPPGKPCPSSNTSVTEAWQGSSPHVGLAEVRRTVSSRRGMAEVWQVLSPCRGWWDHVPFQYTTCLRSGYSGPFSGGATTFYHIVFFWCLREFIRTLYLCFPSFQGPSGNNWTIFYLS